MTKKNYLNNNFIIAMPGMDGSDFSKSVTYLCQHDEEGALGLVINKPHSMTMGDIFKQLNVTPTTPEIANIPLFLGGPVQQERGFVLHSPAGNWESSIVINEQMALTTSKDILEAIAHDEGPEQWIVALGYAGWAAGQLEQEIQRNSWLHGVADADIIFEEAVPLRWELAGHRIGVDISLMSSESGHC
ncbi:MAG: YqgE/AlgH family protein [Cycloclasticus sp.]